MINLKKYSLQNYFDLNSKTNYFFKPLEASIQLLSQFDLTFSILSFSQYKLFYFILYNLRAVISFFFVGFSQSSSILLL